MNSLSSCAARQTFLTEGLTKDNVCNLFEAAPNLLEEEQFALKYIEDNATDVIPSNSFLNLSPDSVLVSVCLCCCHCFCPSSR